MTPVLASLWRGHGRTALVDTGAGAVRRPLARRRAGCPAALGSVGVAPEEITDVVLTHLDFDHAGGVVAGTWPEPTRARLPGGDRARGRFDLDWWWNAEERPLRVGPRILRTLRDAGALETFTRRRRRAPGRARALGSRPLRRAHARSRSRTARACSCTSPDAIHHRSHVEHPQWDQPLRPRARDRAGDPHRAARGGRGARRRTCSPRTSTCPAGSSASVARRPGATTPSG